MGQVPAVGQVHGQDLVHWLQGGKINGATPAEVAEKIIAAINKGTTGAVGKINIGSVKDALRGATDTLTKGAPGITKGAADISKEAEKGLKNLFGK